MRIKICTVYANDPSYPPVYGLVTVIPCDRDHTPAMVAYWLEHEGNREQLLERVLELALKRGWSGVTRADALEACRARARAPWPDAELTPAERYDPWIDAWPWEAPARSVPKVRRPGAAGRSLAYSAALRGQAPLDAEEKTPGSAPDVGACPGEQTVKI